MAKYEIRQSTMRRACSHCYGQGRIDTGERGIESETGAVMERWDDCEVCGGFGSVVLFEVFRNSQRELTCTPGTRAAAEAYARQAAEDDDMRARDDAYGGPYNTREPD
jgi:hypothetical protein